MKKIWCFLLAAGMLLGLCSCQKGIDIKQARADAVAMCTALHEEDGEAFFSYFHPDYMPDDSRRAVFETAFLGKIVLSELTGYEMSYYDTDVGGARCLVKATGTLEDQPCRIEVEFVKTDTGYGASNITFIPKENH